MHQYLTTIKTYKINIEKAIPTVTPNFHFAQKDDIKANIWEMGQIVHEHIAAIPLKEKDEKMVIAIIVLDLSKVRD